jgi:hypothetical protein
VSDISFLAEFAYGTGIDPIDYAAGHVIKSHVSVWLTVCLGREEDPASFPAYGPDLTVDALARRIVGDLLDAGWTAPNLEPAPKVTL